MPKCPNRKANCIGVIAGLSALRPMLSDTRLTVFGGTFRGDPFSCPLPSSIRGRLTFPLTQLTEIWPMRRVGAAVPTESLSVEARPEAFQCSA